MIFTASFDPVTNAQIEFLKEYHRKHRKEMIYLYVKDEGILEREKRCALLKKAIKPYRYLAISDISSDFTLDEEDEERVRQGEFKLCAKGIHHLIIQQHEYLEEAVKYHCKKSRYEHSLRVAILAKELAKENQVDEDKAYCAGLLHDITKDKDENFHQKRLKDKQEILALNPKIWHSYSASIFVKEELGIYDQSILSAIENHTLGLGKSKLNQIIYVADKIEPGRDYSVKKETRLAHQDLQKAVDLVKQEVIDYLKESEEKHV